jgi:LPXTG-motif cell wall-anchored protein
MKKKMKRFLSLVLMAALTVVMMIPSIPAAAAESDTHTITINGSSDNTGSHTYSAYQVLKGRSGSESQSKILTDVDWTDKFTDSKRAEHVTNFIKAIKAEESFKTNGTAWFAGVNEECTTASAKAFLNVLTDQSKFPLNVKTATEKLAKYIGQYFVDNNTAYSSTKAADSQTYTISNVPGGYYLVMDSGSVDKSDFYTNYILDVASDVTVNVKGSKPSVKKQVSLAKDATYTEGVSADSQDTIYFKVTATLPSTIKDYNYYKVVIRDKFEGMTFNQVEEAYIASGEGNTKVKDLTTLPTSANITGKTNEVAFTTIDLVKFAKDSGITLTSSDQLVIKYSAKLDSSAKIGSDVNGNSENVNTATMYYTNNPNVGSDSDATPYDPTKPDDSKGGETPSNKAYVYTFELDGTKIAAQTDQDTEKKLSGAVFTIYKEVEETVNGEAKTVKYYAAEIDNGFIKSWSKEKTAANAATVTSGTDGKFVLKGLQHDLEYKLEETVAPQDYNKLAEPIPFKISATISSNEAADTATLSALSIIVSGTTTNTTSDAHTGIVTANVENAKGSVLPTTGGIGTTMFYVIGGILVAGAAILLIVRKRMSMEE